MCYALYYGVVGLLINYNLEKIIAETPVNFTENAFRIFRKHAFRAPHANTRPKVQSAARTGAGKC